MERIDLNLDTDDLKDIVAIGLNAIDDYLDDSDDCEDSILLQLNDYDMDC